ncbi:MAG: hypothetical protein RJA98_2404 [Pseudomonadota bacterium]|jgi:hypothetical protein
MRAAPALQVTLTHDTAWRLGGWLLAGFSSAVLMTWAHFTARATLQGWPWAVAVLMCAVLLALTRPWRRHAPVQLRWDGQAWHAGPIGPAGSEPWSGQLTVALDLGGWMLLRLSDPPPPAEHLPAWLAAARHQQPAAWHPLRCAVYSPRPQRAPDAMEPGPAPHERP